ncbi:MAG: hypothetical protein ACTHQE_17415 [Thermomicrobiales bacterium]
MTAATPSPFDPQPRTTPPVLDAALIAAEATLRRNTDIAAVFVVAPQPDRSPRQDLTILRVEPDVPAPLLLAPAVTLHVPHWAHTLLASTEGVR